VRKRDNIIELTKTEESEEGLVRYFKWNDKEYSIVNARPFSDDAKVILRAILTQSINDYVKLHPGESTKEEDRFNYQTARNFLFDDDYVIDYGGIDIGIRDLIFFITGTDPNMEMFRAGILRKLDVNNKKKRAAMAAKKPKE
jgi:hypothetical protein